MKSRRWIVGVALITAATLVAASYRADDVAKVMADYVVKKDKLFENGSVKADMFEKLVNETIARMDIKTMSANDVALVNRQGIWPNAKAFPDVLARLDELSDTKDASGALALSISLELSAWLPEPPTEKRKANAQRLLNHPALNELLHSENCEAPITGLSTLTLPNEAHDRVMSLVDQFDPNRIESGSAMSSYWRIVTKLEKDPAKREPIRLKALKIIQGATATAKSKPGQEKMVSILEKMAVRMDGADAKGGLIGHKIPKMDILWASDEKLKSFEDLKGKVVILDFWATWCGPCVASFPNVKELKNHYEGYDVVIVGITSVQGNIIGLDPAVIDTKGDPKKEFGLMPEYMKKKEIDWKVVFTKQDVFNPDFGVSGIPHVAIIDPAGVVRYGGLHPGEDNAKKIKLIDGLLKEFNLKVPAN
ncbi:MAG: hypothetical protein BGO01_19795 [Armatimonadetes bacterium 55-13]|nr:TlpA family protein disulfide reductase [Armatimonadota bacterium]ODU53898.1 MAG: hypothetical protein ABT09_00845 [bacterium SCN 57-13]OJU64356.1 MAG: hypothetical protein BGO01_19795 [Armatimonadetes bacterium 55-13]